MPFYVPFDKYETAVLIKAYMDVEKGSLRRDEAVKRVSETLRKRAIDSGKSVDDKFRCVSGISSQMQKLKAVIEKGNRLPDHINVSQVFMEVVNLYLKDREQFEKILSGSKGALNHSGERIKEPELHVNGQNRQKQITEKNGMQNQGYIKYLNSIMKKIETI